MQVYVSPKHPRQRGERLRLSWDLHYDWREPWRCGAGETLLIAVIRIHSVRIWL